MKRSNFWTVIFLCLTALGLMVLPARVQAAPGDFLFQFGQNLFATATLSAVDNSGNLYLTAYTRIYKLDNTGKLLAQWGGDEAVQNEFLSTSGIAVDAAGYVYVADGDNNKISKFDPSGKYLMQWGGPGDGNGLFNRPSAVAVDRSGNVYVAEYQGNRIQKFDSSGRFLTQWGTAGNGSGQFNFPTSLTVDCGGNVYVADGWNIQKFDSAGRSLTTWKGEAGNSPIATIGSIVADCDGNVYVADRENGSIQKFNSGGVLLAQWSGSAIAAGEVMAPNRVALDGNGKLYVGDSKRVVLFDSTGRYLAQRTRQDDSAPLTASGVAVDSSGKVYVSEQSQVEVFDSTGNFLTKWESSGTGLAISPCGYLYVGTRKYTISGTYVNTITVPLSPSGIPITPVWSPSAVAVDSACNAYVTEYHFGEIFKFDSSENFLVRWDKQDTTFPTGIALDSTGYAYVAGTQRISKYDPAGQVVARWAAAKGLDVFLSDVAVDVNGNVYARETRNFLIQVFDDEGNLKGQFHAEGSGIATNKDGSLVYVAGNGVQVFEGFGVNYTLSYGAGPGGGISGVQQQTVRPGGNGSTVTAIAGTGYRFASWSDGVTSAARTDTNVQANLSVTANFAATAQSSNIASLATVTASSQNTPTGQTAVKAVDGVIGGYPGDYTKEWATASQKTGAWLNLSWSAPYSVTQVVLYDRPNLNDQITSATITFSDGSSMVVGPLNNNGTATTYSFPARVITGLRMTVTGVSSSTGAVGLSEIQVYGTAAGGTQYTLATSVSPSGAGSVTANPSQSGYPSGTQVVLTAASNAGYTFSGWSGGASGTANPLTVTMTGNLSVTANFSAGAQPTNIAPQSTVTASSQDTTTGQTAVKAVDRVIDGYPGDYTKEWATIRQGAGAWLNLAWSTPYSVSQVTLYDRPNLDDNITSATLAFSDGTSITIGPLNNNGAATTYTFPARVITSLRMTVTGVSSSTGAVGLSEIQVSGTPAVTTQYTLTTSVAPSGSGSITANPSQPSYPAGSQVVLTASPNTGFSFSGWSGGAGGTVNPLTVTMTGNLSISANFTPLPGSLAVTPATGLSATGAPGGPFTPSSAAYTLQNTGNSAITWSAVQTQPWTTLSLNGGSLAAGATATVTVSLNATAATLPVGSYSGAVNFTNATNGSGNTTRAVKLTVASAQPVNIAPLAAVTASTQNTTTGQTAVKAVDGVIDGYPGDYTKEWATAGQKVGAWLNLAWTSPYTVTQVVLYDRPNLNDNITSATLAFSDGTSITVGPLNNNGTATTYTFPAKVTTSVRMTVTGVSGSTGAVGLSEIQVFGTPK
jgi:uncharacterized repeat protein (TIGR02543 family)